MGSIFKKGFEVNRENQKRQEAAAAVRGRKLFDFFLKNNGDEADVRFLTEEPINYKRHTIPVGDKYENYTCTGENCPYCERGDRPKDNGAFLLVDHRKYTYTDKDGNKKEGKDSVRFYTQGTRVVSQLDRISEKYGLTNRDITIVRLGSGTSTTYTFERGDEEKLTESEIREYLPQNLRDKYDGTMESLYAIVEEQLMMRTPDYVPEEDEEEEISSSADNIVSIEKEEPKKKSLFKKPQNSLKKPMAKDLLPFV